MAGGLFSLSFKNTKTTNFGSRGVFNLTGTNGGNNYNQIHNNNLFNIGSNSNSGVVTWSNIRNKPACFTPCVHSIDLVTGTGVGYAYWNGTVWSFSSISNYISSIADTSTIDLSVSVGGELTAAFTSMNISQFSNNSGYITSSALTGYATETWVTNNFQLAGTYATANNTMTFTNKSGNISQWTNNAGYLTSAVISVTGTPNRITSTGGINPVIDIASGYVGQTSISTLGTITTGIWNGTAITNSYLANSNITIGSTSISLGASSATLAGLTSVTSSSFVISGNISSSAWTTNGLRIKGVSATLTDTTSSGTVAAAYTNVLGGNTIAATNSTTYTDYITAFYREPTAGSNVTFTNKWAIGAESLLITKTITTAGSGYPFYTQVYKSGRAGGNFFYHYVIERTASVWDCYALMSESSYTNFGYKNGSNFYSFMVIANSATTPYLNIGYTSITGTSGGDSLGSRLYLALNGGLNINSVAGGVLTNTNSSAIYSTTGKGSVAGDLLIAARNVANSELHLVTQATKRVSVFYNGATEFFGATQYPYVTKSANYTLTDTDKSVEFTAAATATLPDIVTSTTSTSKNMGRVYIIINTSGSNVTISRNTTGQIWHQGVAANTYTLATNKIAIIQAGAGTDYRILSVY